jgi:hypothetical protein
MDTFKFKITLDCHNGIQNLNYYDLPDPPRFSLPSTFKHLHVVRPHLQLVGCNIFSSPLALIWPQNLPVFMTSGILHGFATLCSVGVSSHCIAKREGLLSNRYPIYLPLILLWVLGMVLHLQYHNFFNVFTWKLYHQNLFIHKIVSNS